MAKHTCPDCEVALKEGSALWVVPRVPPGTELGEWIETTAHTLYCPSCMSHGVDWEALTVLALAAAEGGAPVEAQFPLRLPRATRDLIKVLAKSSRRGMNDVLLEYIIQGLREEAERDG